MRLRKQDKSALREAHRALLERRFRGGRSGLLTEARDILWPLVWAPYAGSPDIAVLERYGCVAYPEAAILRADQFTGSENDALARVVFNRHTSDGVEPLDSRANTPVPAPLSTVTVHVSLGTVHDRDNRTWATMDTGTKNALSSWAERWSEIEEIIRYRCDMFDAHLSHARRLAYLRQRVKGDFPIDQIVREAGLENAVPTAA